MLPVILLSPLPLQLGKEPSSALLCARPCEGQWRRACVGQKLGATALSNSIYQLLTNFTAQGCTNAGVELEVILPRLLLQVRGSSCEVVCGLRVKGILEEKEETPELLRLSQDREETEAPTEEIPSGSSSSAAEDLPVESAIDWSPWIYKAPPKELTPGALAVEMDCSISRTRPDLSPRRSPRAVIDLRLIEHGVTSGLRSRKWWAGPTGAAEKLLPVGVKGLPQKLPLIGEQLKWRPKGDTERGLHRAWKECKSLTVPVPRMPERPQAMLNFLPLCQTFPKSARASQLKSVDCYRLKDSKWLWRCLVEGGPIDSSKPPSMEERFGRLQEHFEQLYQQLERTCFAQWVSLGPAAKCQERPQNSLCYTGGGGCLLPPQHASWPEDAEETASRQAIDPLDASSPCERCQHRALATVSLQGSMMSYILGSPVCAVCLHCGHCTTNLSLRAELLQEEAILEVTTSALLRPGDSEMLQRCIAQVLRVEDNCCCVALSQATSRAESRVASISFALARVTTAAAASVVNRLPLEAQEERSRPFANDQTWITSALADTGLDLHYDRMRSYSVDVAIQELDDKRMLRIRQEVSPIVLWLELAYLLSPTFSLIRWNRALAEAFGSVTLTAAVLMRMNINRLRQVAGAGAIPWEESEEKLVEAEARGGRLWPLALHRVIVVKESALEETLAVAMEGAGLIQGGLEALRRLGEERQQQHFAGIDDQFQQELSAGKQDVEQTSVATAMAVLAKTRTMFGTSSRALLQARRILKRKQVFLFLRDLYTSIVSDQDQPEWLRDGSQAEEQSEEGSSSSDAEEVDLDDDDEDLMIHAPREVRERLDESKKPQGLTIIKVLGHFSEYVHFSQMALMCIQVLGVMLRTALRVKSNATSITMRPAQEYQQNTNIEQAMLTHGFIPAALRALYRHPTDPAICRETLLLLAYLANEEAEHNEHVQAKLQLLEPPERPFTLLLTISKLNSLEDRSNLLLCLQVYVTISTFPVPVPSSETKEVPARPKRAASRRNSRRKSSKVPKEVRVGARLEPSREPEAAHILVAVLTSQWRDQAVFSLVHRIILISCEQQQMCRCLFEAGLTSALRSFLRKIRRGEVAQFWFEDKKERAGLKARKSLKKAKEVVMARMRVDEAIRGAQENSWHMLRILAVNAGGGPEQAEKAHEDYKPDTWKSIAQALDEMRQVDHGPQWPLAVKFLEALLLYDFPAHGEFFQAQDGLTLALAELPNGQVADVYPLFVAVLRLHLRSIPCSPQYCPVAEERQVQLRRGDTFPRPLALEAKPLTSTRTKRQGTLPDLPLEGEFLTCGQRLTNEAKAFLAEQGAVPVLLESLLDAESAELEDGLLRLLSELLQDVALGAEKASEEFMNFGLADQGGSEVVLQLMKGNLKNRTRVEAALFALAGAITHSPDCATKMASEMGAKVLIQSVWRYWEEVDFRRRSLMLLRQIRDANHELTGFMLMHWKAHLAALELGQVKDPDEESKVEEAEVAEEESPAQPMDDPGPEEEPQADAPAEEEAAPEESPKMTHLDEGTLDMEVEVLKDMDDPRPGSSLSDLKSTPEVPDAPKQAELTKGVEATVEPFSGANLPREMRHFLALLRVHRFEQKSSILDIPDLVQAIVEFNDDAELSRFGIKALMSGTAMEQEMRLPTIGRCPNFVKSVRRMVQKEGAVGVLQLQLRLILGILDNDPTDYQDWVEVDVLAVAKVLQATNIWTSNAWEVILSAITEAMRTPHGKIQLQNFNVALSLYKEWEKLKDNPDDALAKMLVSSFFDQTERTLEMIG